MEDRSNKHKKGINRNVHRHSTFVMSLHYMPLADNSDTRIILPLFGLYLCLDPQIKRENMSVDVNNRNE